MCLVQGALVTAMKAVSQRSPQGGRPLPEWPNPRAAFLEAFPCLNPFSAQQLASLQCSMKELLHRPPDELKRLVPGLPARSLHLFMRQAALGEPVLGAQTLGRTSPPLSGGIWAFTSGCMQCSNAMQGRMTSISAPVRTLTSPSVAGLSIRLLPPGRLSQDVSFMQDTPRLPCQIHCFLQTPFMAMKLAALKARACPPPPIHSYMQSMLLQSTHQRTRTTQNGSRMAMQMMPPTLRLGSMVSANILVMVTGRHYICKHSSNITMNRNVVHLLLRSSLVKCRMGACSKQKPNVSASHGASHETG